MLGHNREQAKCSVLREFTYLYRSLATNRCISQIHSVLAMSNMEEKGEVLGCGNSSCSGQGSLSEEVILEERPDESENTRQANLVLWAGGELSSQRISQCKGPEVGCINNPKTGRPAGKGSTLYCACDFSSPVREPCLLPVYRGRSQVQQG